MTLLSHAFWKKFIALDPTIKVKFSLETLSDAVNRDIPITGAVDVTIGHNDKFITHPVYIVRHLTSHLILGTDFFITY